MKTLFFPYLTRHDKNGWNTAVCLVNRGYSKTVLEMTYDSTVYGGNSISSKQVVLTKRGSFIYLPQVQGKFCLEIVMSDNVFVDATVFGPDGTSSKTPEIVNLVVNPSTDLQVFGTSPYWTFKGNPSCNNLRADYMSMIRIAAAKVHYLDETKTGLGILDACPRNGNCPNHPGSAHSSKGDAVDLEYFDPNKQSYFYNELVNLADNVFFRTHTDKINELKNTGYYPNFKHKLIADDNPNYNHQFHVHVEWR